ncbi:MAG TPA: hypothetical protein VII60_02450 [Acidimicrobiales bacterium]
MANAAPIDAKRDLVDTIVSMRRIVVAVLIAIVIVGVAWALLPATKWPHAFCAPIVRVVGTDADAIARSFSHPEPTLTVAQEDQVNKLMYDATLAQGAVPTAQLRAELNRYFVELGGVLSTNSVTNAMSQFDQQARTQLRACGITPIGS